MSDDLLFAIAATAIGIAVAMYGTAVLVGARRKGTVRLLGLNVGEHAGTAFHAMVAVTVLVTVASYLAAFIGVMLLIVLGSSTDL